MAGFLDICNLQKLNQNGVNNLNWSITFNEIEAAIKNLTIITIKSPRLDNLKAKFYYTVKEDLKLILLTLLHKIYKEGTFWKFFQS
jgi:hypothetical protein